MTVPSDEAMKAARAIAMMIDFHASEYGLENIASKLDAFAKDAAEAARRDERQRWVKELKRQFRLADHIGDMMDPDETAEKIARGAAK